MKIVFAMLFISAPVMGWMLARRTWPVVESALDRAIACAVGDISRRAWSVEVAAHINDAPNALQLFYRVLPYLESAGGLAGGVGGFLIYHYLAGGFWVEPPFTAILAAAAAVVVLSVIARLTLWGLFNACYRRWRTQGSS